jgi:hypothetical protein
MESAYFGRRKRRFRLIRGKSDRIRRETCEVESIQCRVKIKKKDWVEACRESLQGGGDLLRL